jgi:hypothetical protein
MTPGKPRPPLPRGLMPPGRDHRQIPVRPHEHDQATVPTLAMLGETIVAGRGASCDELQGDGAATLRARSQTP